MWILSSREKAWVTWCEVFMELLRAYLKQTKIFLIAFVFLLFSSWFLPIYILYLETITVSSLFLDYRLDYNEHHDRDSTGE